METKQFKAESKRLLEMMIHSIYTHKEIFLRELISNASDAIDKLYFKSLTDDKVGLNKDDFAIWITADEDSRTLKIEDNGIGMTAEELENNLGTIANSGSLKFKTENKLDEESQIIGQFGVGFYSAFMVAKKVTVISKAYGSDKAYQWESEGVDGYTISEADKKNPGTVIILELLEDNEDESYGEKYMASFVGNVVESMNPLTYLPFVKDIVSIVQGDEVERTDMAVIGDLVNAWRKLGSDKLKPWEKVEQFAGAVAQMFGLPLKNILRDTRAIWQTVANTGSHMKITGSGAKNAAIEGITGSKSSRADRMYQAALDGDTEYVDRLKGLYKDETAARTAMTDAIRDALEDEDITAEEAMDHLERLTDRTKEESESRVRYWLYKLQNPEGELGEAALTRYHEKVESSGISLDQYAEYLEKLPDQANREETLAVINSMKLTRAQKDALYRAAGYAESRLDEAPWH